MTGQRWMVVGLASMLAATVGTQASAATASAATARSTTAGVTAADAATARSTTAGAAAGVMPVSLAGVKNARGSDLGIEAIFGADGRVPVSPTTSFPASAVVLLTYPGGRCSGFMISARTVATAGHCVHTGGSGGAWRGGIVAYPGSDGAIAPFGSCAAAALFAPQGWTNAADPGSDYGAVQLNCAVGNATGWFALGWTSGSLVGSCTINSSYPVDKPGTQWRSWDYLRAETTNLVYHQHDTVGGQDGSALYVGDTDELCPRPPGFPVPPRPWPFTVLAIHVSGPQAGVAHNVGTRITQAAYNNLMAWR